MQGEVDSLGQLSPKQLYAIDMILLGHDDDAPRARARMRRAEREVLAALGLPAVYGPEDERRHEEAS